MSYVKQNFVDGQTLTAAQLNHMEAGIANAAGTQGEKGDPGPAGAKGDPGEGFTANAKALLLNLFENAAYKTNTMQPTLNALRAEWGGSAQEVPVQSVSLSAVTMTLNESESKTLTATVLPANATDRAVVWSVLPTGFATVANGVVTGIKAGNCTVTATAGGKSASCAVTVEVVETAQLIYSLPGETVLTQGLDTGLKLLEHASTETPQYTILVDAKAGDDFNANTWPAFLHCLTETGDTDNLPGFNSTSSPLNNKTEFAYYNYGGVTLSDSIEHLKTRTRYAVQIDGRKYRGGSTYCPLTEWKTTNGTIIDVPQTFLIGAAQSADGSKKQQFWSGTLYQCRVYKGLLSDDKVNDYIENDFLQTTTSQQSYNRLPCVQIILNTKFSVCLMIIRSELIHLLCRRIAYIMNRILVFFLKEINLKRQDGKEFGYIPLDTADTPFLPCPYLRRYIIVSRYQSVLFQKLSNIQIKTRIIYKNHHVRFPFHNILLAFFHIGKDGTQMQENRHKTHICQFLIMLDTGSTFSSHQVTTEEPKLCQFIHFFQRAHQSAGMQITTCLAYYQIILHILA